MYWYIIKKKLDHKSKIDKIYDSLNLELKHLIYSYYKNYEITHIILNKCIADGVQFEELPIEKKEVSELKIDFKIICFPRKTLDELRANFSKINLNVICVYCNSYVKSQSYIKIKFRKFLFRNRLWENIINNLWKK